MTPLAAYVLLFVAVGVGFIFVHLLAGKLIRPSKPSAEKGTIYECGEPTIGSAWIQFDLRFYVVALLFVIFDVEVAFFFPWAEVFGKANDVANAPPPQTAAQFRELGRKQFDLAGPGLTDRDLARPAQPGEVERVRQARSWQALRNLSDEQFAAYNRFGATPGRRRAQMDDDEKEKQAVAVMLRNFRPATYEAVQRLAADPAGRQSLRQIGKKYDAALGTFLGAQKKAAGEVLAGLDKLAGKEKQKISAEQLRDTLQRVLAEQEAMLRVLPILELRAERPLAWRLLNGAPAPLVAALREAAPGAVDRANRRTTDAERELSAAAIATENEALALLFPGPGEPPREQRRDLSGAALRKFGSFDDDDYQALAVLPQPALQALTDDIAGSTRQPARQLAWVALLDVLVFFGVLLVGFAYLWKRGDLAWVRSTAAEKLTMNAER